MANITEQKQNFLKGIVRENPVFVMLLGMCPALGVTSSAFNGLGMGLATLFVLLMSNVVVSLIKIKFSHGVFPSILTFARPPNSIRAAI